MKHDPKLKQLVYITAGQLSMQWKPVPSGVYQTDETVEICNNLINQLHQLYSLEPKWLLNTAQQLAAHLAHKHFPDAPNFQPLDTLAGVISQIDNMTTGMSGTPSKRIKLDTFSNHSDLGSE